MVTRVSGGIITDQMLAGSLRYFEFGKTGIGADAIGDGNQRAWTASIAAAGSGYAVNDVLTVSGGTTGGGGATTFTVKTIGPGGEVTSVALTNDGEYSVLPADPAATTVAPAGGTGATLSLEYTSLIQIPNYTTGDGGAYYVGVNAAVPGSIADQVLQVVSRRANIVQIALVTDNAFQIAVENTGYGWLTIDGSGPSEPGADDDMLDAINALGTITVPDTSASGTTFDLSTGVTITEKFFSAGIT